MGNSGERGSEMSQSTGSLRLQNLAHAYKQSGALKAAINLDLFTVIAHGAREISQIAEEIGLSHQIAQKLADVCSSLGLLEYKDGGLYYNAPDVESHLVKGEKGYLGPWLTAGEEAFNLWADIAPILKGDKPPVAKGTYEQAWKDVDAARRTNRRTYNIGVGAGYRLARSFDFSPYSLLLDLGGGSGAYSIAIALTYPEMKAVVMDYPTVCTSAEEFIADAGLSERITTHPGDLLTVDFPSGADVMLMSSNMPNFSTSGLATVYRKAFSAMEKGGAIIILGEAMYDNRNGPLESAYWHLEETLAGGPGETHTISEVCQLLEKAGFTGCEVSEFAPGLLTRFIAHKPK